MKITVNVTQHDIRQGRRAHGVLCPIARALNRRARYAPVHVSQDSVKFRDRHGELVYPGIQHEDRIRNFIRDFDAGSNAAKPFRFTLDVPKRLLK